MSRHYFKHYSYYIRCIILLYYSKTRHWRLKSVDIDQTHTITFNTYAYHDSRFNMNKVNTILDPFKDLHTEADLIHVYPHKTKKAKRRWDMINLLTFSSKYLKTLEIIKHEKRVAEAKRPLDDKLVLSIRDELTPSGIQMILNTDRFSNNKSLEQSRANRFRISSPNRSLFKRLDNEKYIREKGPNYWMIVDQVNNKCIHWVLQNFPKQ